MGDAGSAHARFRRALLTKNMTLIDAAARELGHVALDDALRVLTVMAEKQDARYERAAARWSARLAAERQLGLDDRPARAGGPRVPAELSAAAANRTARPQRTDVRDPRGPV